MTNQCLQSCTERNSDNPVLAKNHDYRANPHPAHDAYTGAMRLRYVHGLTGYKAQGGDWNHVILHPWFHENDYRYARTGNELGTRKRLVAEVKTDASENLYI
ncbi:hypothetical protein DYBT9275_04737 [Dyadobacter sp. CECT 9275]|uniref:Uncharacterized protein n=1 Tax=Dyadobacter helix TaxID=2822344 RepID=A0A916N6M6_9BACT|nr:hypothetical protein [Dyadobacter sp. CECT 9275]CAG5010507.1 hypothetical protein DYBT9275_04737 [Dyadobacter sp. CECT 9275]